MGKKPPIIHVRCALPDDVPRLLHIEHECFDDPLSEKQIAKIMAHPRKWILVAGFNVNEALGHIVYCEEKRRPVLVIDRVAVDPERRRLGIGERLVRKVAARNRSPKQWSIEAELPDAALPEAHALFKKCDFRLLGLPKNGFTKVFLPLLPGTRSTAKTGKAGDVI